MSAILKFDFEKRKQLHFLEESYLKYTKKDPILHVTITVSLKHGQTIRSSGPIWVPLKLTMTDTCAAAYFTRLVCIGFSELSILTFISSIQTLKMLNCSFIRM